MIFYGTKPASYVEKINNCCVAWSNLAEFWNIFNPKQIGEDCHNIVKVTKTTSIGSNLNAFDCKVAWITFWSKYELFEFSSQKSTTNLQVFLWHENSNETFLVIFNLFLKKAFNKIIFLLQEHYTVYFWMEKYLVPLQDCYKGI